VETIDSILVTVDFTPTTEGVLKRALWLASHASCKVRLVHVVDTRILDGIAQFGVTARSEFEASVREAADSALEALVARFHRAGAIDVAAECRFGKPSDVLVVAARDHAPSLMIAGAGNRHWRQVMLGSTSRRLLRGLHCPLWLVRGDGTREINSILLASDLQPASARATAIAASLWPQAEFELLHVAEHLPDLVAGLADAKRGEMERVRSELQQKTYEKMEAFTRVSLAGRKTVTRLEEGHPVGVVLRRLQESRPGLLVMGRSGRQGFEAAVLGSVAEALLEMVECDVLLAPAAAP
jgi:nucleotide-binding universal stress UspA family protein